MCHPKAQEVPLGEAQPGDVWRFRLLEPRLGAATACDHLCQGCPRTATAVKINTGEGGYLCSSTALGTVTLFHFLSSLQDTLRSVDCRRVPIILGSALRAR
jgi:hypothetical protein